MVGLSWPRIDSTERTRKLIEKAVLAHAPHDADEAIDAYVGAASQKTVIAKSATLLSAVGDKSPSLARPAAATLVRERASGRAPSLAAAWQLAVGTGLAEQLAAQCTRVIGGGLLGISTPHPSLHAATAAMLQGMLLNERVAWRLAQTAREADLTAYAAFHNNPLGARFVKKVRAIYTQTLSVSAHIGNVFMVQARVNPPEDPSREARETSLKTLLPLVGPPLEFDKIGTALQTAVVRDFARDLDDATVNYALAFYQSEAAKRLAKNVEDALAMISKDPAYTRQVKDEAVRLHSLFTD